MVYSQIALCNINNLSEGMVGTELLFIGDLATEGI